MTRPVLLLVLAAALLTTTVSTPAGEEDETRRIGMLIQNLRSSLPAVRDRAAASLEQLGGRAIPALEEAAGSPRPEVAERAGQILRAILQAYARLQDALGNPMPEAVLEIDAEEGPLILEADAQGLVPLPPEPHRTPSRPATVHHPEFGRGRVLFRSDAVGARYQAALVRKGTPEHERALRGVVVDPAGAPLAGARIRCNSIRTPGEGLISAPDPLAVFSGSEGEFAVYLPDRGVGSTERGSLVPPNSRYHIVVEPPDDSGLFPLGGAYPNTGPARLVLPRPERFYTMDFEDADGGTITDLKRLRGVSMTYRPRENGAAIYLGARFAELGGGRLIPGRYEVRLGEAEYQPVEVTTGGPEHLTFRLPPLVTFSGRIVDGTTGEPMAGALVLGYSAISHNNLAWLSEDDWEALHALPASPSLENPAVQRLGELYSVEGLARAGDDGHYELTRPRGKEIYALVGFEEDRIPYQYRTHRLLSAGGSPVVVPDLPLFPAARVFVEPVFPQGRISVSPRWKVSREDQPAWAERFLSAQDSGQERECAYVHWLKLNELQPLHVPAGLRVELQFEAPYAPEWVPGAFPTPLRLEAGEQRVLGKLEFTPALEVRVQVLDESRRPVEGIPVRIRRGEPRSWSVTHNSDEGGLVRFFAPPRTRCGFRVSDFPRDSGEARAPNVTVYGELGDEAPEEPFSITLTARQIELLVGPQGSPGAPPRR